MLNTFSRALCNLMGCREANSFTKCPVPKWSCNPFSYVEITVFYKKKRQGNFTAMMFLIYWGFESFKCKWNARYNICKLLQNESEAIGLCSLQYFCITIIKYCGCLGWCFEKWRSDVGFQACYTQFFFSPVCVFSFLFCVQHYLRLQTGEWNRKGRVGDRGKCEQGRLLKYGIFSHFLYMLPFR